MHVLKLFCLIMIIIHDVTHDLVYGPSTVFERRDSMTKNQAGFATDPYWVLKFQPDRPLEFKYRTQLLKRGLELKIKTN